MSDQNQAVTPSVLTPTGSISIADLGALFRRDASAADRAQALQSFGATVRTRLQGATTAAQGADTIAERSGQLLSEVIARLPIRRAEDLRHEFGTDPDLSAQHVIDDGVRLAQWLWTAAKAIPAPETALHAAKVVVHCAIEIRMVGELLEAHRDPDIDGAPTPLPAILVAWAAGVPDAPTGSTSVGEMLVTQTRRALNELRGSDGRIKGLLTRGREGGKIVGGLGQKVNGGLRRRAIP